VQDSEVSLQRPLSFGSHGEQYFANKLSLNLLQDRLACASQLSLKGVIATNLVVNFGQNLKKFRRVKSHRPSQVSLTCSTGISAFVNLVGGDCVDCYVVAGCLSHIRSDRYLHHAAHAYNFCGTFMAGSIPLRGGRASEFRRLVKSQL
jgi:hypothetical protein